MTGKNMLLDGIQSDLKEAQLARDEVKVSTLRLLLSEIKNAEIAKVGDLSDQDIISVIQKEVKKRKEAATAFRSGGREEAAVKEEVESRILEQYLPAQLSTGELTNIVEDTINEMGAATVQDMGKVIGAVMSKVKGQADGGAVSSIVKERFAEKI